MPAKLIVNIDHDKTLNKDYTTTIAAGRNKALDPREMLAKMKQQSIFFDKQGQGIETEQVIQKYMEAKGVKSISTLVDIARLGEWALYEEGCMTKNGLIELKASLLVGLTKSELDEAAHLAPRTLAPHALHFTSNLAKAGHAAIIMSDGWAPVVKGVVDFLALNGVKIESFCGHTPVFESGVFTGGLVKVNKWEEAYKIYDKLGFKQNGSGVYEHAVSIDDSAANLEQMKRHGLAIAYNPTAKDTKAFDTAGFKNQNFCNVWESEGDRRQIQTDKNFMKTWQDVKNYALYASNPEKPSSWFFVNINME
ncbi:MAG: hypothetical protein WC506_00200 [Candidatus Micrarchaeia archaeon]